MITVEEAKKLVDGGRLRYIVRQYLTNNNRRFAGETKSVIRDLNYDTICFVRDCHNDKPMVKNAMEKLLTYYPEHKVKNTTPIQCLINLLTEQTQTLKEQYLIKVEEYAVNEFNHLMKFVDWKYEQWVEKFPRNILNKEKEVIGKELSIDGYSFRNKVYNARNTGKDKYIAKEIKKAVLHYENSIVKLAYRIEKKGLNLDKITVKTSHIGVNINTWITDGEQTVHAYTIIASGEIQRPHYRYLIK